MLNFFGIVVAILKMETGRNSGHHNLPTYEICHNTAQIQHCPISTTFHMWVDYDVPELIPEIEKLMTSDNVEFLPPIFYAVFW
jgi:hypothetical protein